ncbi:MAG TPA: hypothetical protein VFT42_11340, partial [Solirubrobacteraceae bacterium]|nr:hypothetical protein [Solirubrobacteraceae bacterium]
HLRGEVRQVFMEWLRSYRPDLVEHYEELYRRGAYAPDAERARLAALIRQPGGPPLARFNRQMGSAEPSLPLPAPSREAERKPVQEPLF